MLSDITSKDYKNTKRKGEYNKKSKLMLTKRARAYGSSCSQVILVYLHPFHRNSLFCRRKSQKNH